jgi:hypothetical protein
MPKYQLNKWRHPKTEEVRIYLNGLETTQDKVYFERGERQGTALPPIYGIRLCTSSSTITDETKREVAEAFSDMDLFLDKTDWTRLGKAANW